MLFADQVQLFGDFIQRLRQLNLDPIVIYPFKRLQQTVGVVDHRQGSQGFAADTALIPGMAGTAGYRNWFSVFDFDVHGAMFVAHAAQCSKDFFRQFCMHQNHSFLTRKLYWDRLI